MNESLEENDTHLTVSIVAVGLTSLVTQVILLRELLSVFYGNELVIGVLLANWMTLTGLGAYLGRYVSRRDHDVLPALLLLLATLPYGTVLGLRLLRNTVFPIGVMVGIVPIIWSSFILLIPFCVLSGASFSLIAGFKPKTATPGLIGSLYAWESIGSVIGGVLFSLVLFHYLHTFQCLAALMALDLAAALFVVRSRKTARVVVWGLAILILLPVIVLQVDVATKRLLFPDQKILFSRDTPYGSLVVTRQAEQENFYENNVLLSSTNDVTGAEEAVHYAMVQLTSPQAVLMISGGVMGIAREVLKYKIQKLDYVEVNPYLMDLSRSYSPSLSDSRVQMFNVDPRVFVRENQARHDVVLLSVPDPSTIQINRYYTLEFFHTLKDRMSQEGVLSLSLLSSAEYQSNEVRSINSTMVNTLKEVFGNVLIVPGLRTYFLASDAKLDIHVGKLVTQRGINNTYVNQYYLDDEMIAQRSDLLHRSLEPDAPLNSDFAPVSYYRQVTHWLTYFRSNLWLVALIALLFFLFAAVQMNAVSAGVFAGGFAASSVEVLLLISFQILYGYVYEALGIVVTIFMAGLFVGSFWRAKLIPRASVSSYAKIQAVIALYCFVLPLMLLLLRELQGSSALIQGIIIFLTFVIAALVGMQFSIAADLRQGQSQRVASELYGVDLIGSALGALLVTIALIPMLGILAASVVPGMLSLSTALAVLVRRKSAVGITE
jgi:spermidine synthase